MHMRLNKRRRNHVQEQMSELPQDAKNDSLAAAQVIFKRHADNANSTPPSPIGLDSAGHLDKQADTAQRVHKVGTPSGTSSSHNSGNEGMHKVTKPLGENTATTAPIAIKQPVRVVRASPTAIVSPTSHTPLDAATAAANVVAEKSKIRTTQQQLQDKKRRDIENAHHAASAAAVTSSNLAVGSPPSQYIPSVPTLNVTSPQMRNSSQSIDRRSKSNEEAHNGHEKIMNSRSNSINSSTIKGSVSEPNTVTPLRQNSPSNMDDIIQKMEAVDIDEGRKNSFVMNGSGDSVDSLKPNVVRRPMRTPSGRRVRPPSPIDKIGSIQEPHLESTGFNDQNDFSEMSSLIDGSSSEDITKIRGSGIRERSPVDGVEHGGISVNIPMQRSLSSDVLSPSQQAAMVAATKLSPSTQTLPVEELEYLASTGDVSAYKALNKINGTNMAYKGTIPDLIPSRARAQKTSKLKFKIFGGGKNSDRRNNATPIGYDPVMNISTDFGGKKVVESNQNNVKFKTTMRSQKYLGNDNLDDNDLRTQYIDDDDDDDDYDSAYEDLDYSRDDSEAMYKGDRESSNPRSNSLLQSSSYSGKVGFNSNANSGTSINNSGNVSNLDYSLRDGVAEKKKSRRDKIKKKLKSTASVVPYYPHYALTHLASGVSTVNSNLNNSNKNTKWFNEDKPWKSHKDVGFVTSQERKRYEAMWVTNRYLYLNLLPWWPKEEVEKDEDDSASNLNSNASTNVGGVLSDGDNEEDDVTRFLLSLPADGLMLNLVAKDIWERSNLPNDLLKQIYDLVDTRKDGTLNRESFLVGMWLVDQCLYGRKLPQELDPKIWDSVDRWVLNVVNSTMMTALERKQKKKMMKKELKNIKREQKQAIAEQHN
ncbi:Increased rDNA silencing protein 4 [Nakaseomyces glabratus]|nr:Increased rDNA silencing protein [Nakaseomyces glabratus]KTB12897.1 Increased rDNA silencing protein 4 [Nakaseomyces glabratus]KTB16579.1 Increased rDNA silencing protein 4 [Nakaseomyces glabratus]